MSCVALQEHEWTVVWGEAEFKEYGEKSQNNLRAHHHIHKTIRKCHPLHDANAKQTIISQE